MLLKNWLAPPLAVVLLSAMPAVAFAQDTPADQSAAPQLPAACVKAGATTEEQCKAILDEAKAAADKAAADKAAAEQAAQQKAAEEEAAKKAAAEQAAQQKAAEEEAAKKAAADKAAAATAAAEQAAADKAAAEKAAADKAAADKAAADKAAADKAAADKAAAEQAAQEKAAQEEAAKKAAADKAAARKAAAEKAAADKAAADKAAADQAAADKAAADKAAADKAAADKAAADKAAAEKAAADKAAAAANANAPAAGTDQSAGQLPQDCIDAGVTTAADCDALHAINSQKGKPGGRGKPGATPNGKAPGGMMAPGGKMTPGGKMAPAGKAAPAAPAAGEATPAGGEAAPAGEQPAAPAATTEQPAAEQPSAEPQPPATTPEVTPAKPEATKPAEQPAANAAPALPDIEPGLTAAAKAYNRAAAALAKGPDPKATATIKAQQAKMDELCKSVPFGSTAQCLAQYGIQLAPLPADAGTQPIPVAQPVEVLPTLPKGVTPNEVAPLLDSAKDAESGKGPAAPAQGAAQQPPAAAPTPPPKDDKAAQAAIKPGKITPIEEVKGQEIKPGEAQFQVPQNVTVINQTVVNNTTNTTINNTQVNNGPGQQNNVAVGGQQPGNQQPGQNGGPGRPGSHRPGNGPGGNGPGGQGGPGGPGGPGGTTGEPLNLGLQMILQLGNQLIINSPGQDRHRIANRPDDHTTYEELPGHRYRETIIRPNGVRIVTIYNRNGDILRRSRFDARGHETVLAYFDPRYDDELANWRDPGADLPPLRLTIPARDYVLDADEADEADVQRFFAAPPVEPVQRLYSIDEVKRSARIRDMVRRLEVGDLTFDTGAATISEDQVGNLSKVAQAMLALLKKNPAETFLIEGHTDAVGSDQSNLVLSDERAQTVAQILTDFYHIPPENLATQGYGERFLKVQTDGPERLNRRVTIRRITPLVTVTAGR
ncbi:MAG: OmpA family protein [Devosia sp.]